MSKPEPAGQHVADSATGETGIEIIVEKAEGDEGSPSFFYGHIAFSEVVTFKSKVAGRITFGSSPLDRESHNLASNTPTPLIPYPESEPAQVVKRFSFQVNNASEPRSFHRLVLGNKRGPHKSLEFFFSDRYASLKATFQRQNEALAITIVNNFGEGIEFDGVTNAATTPYSLEKDEHIALSLRKNTTFLRLREEGDEPPPNQSGGTEQIQIVLDGPDDGDERIKIPPGS